MKDTEPKKTVTDAIGVELIDEEPTTSPVASMASFVFDPADPYAVRIEFDTLPVPTVWVFARDLLLKGFYEPSGEGDVQVFPFLDRRGSSSVAIALRSQNGEAFFQVSAREVAVFMRKMLESVPLGAEDGSGDLDAELDEILGGSAR